MDDQRAVKLLKKACWNASGWKVELDLTPEELAYLESAGFAPRQQVCDHDEYVARAGAVLARTSIEAVSDAFVASLTTQKLEYRSALGSYAYLHMMPDHKFKRAKGFPSAHCAICGSSERIKVTQKDFVAFNFERYKWGGVRHDDLEFMVFDLEMFCLLPEIQPGEADRQALKAILDAAADATTGKSVSSLKKVIRKIIKANDAEADTLCHILSYAGILATEKNKGFDGQFVSFVERDDHRPVSDQRYPLNCWKGPGYRAEAVRYWFPEIARFE